MNGQRFDLDRAFGLRDHSWGPRFWQSPWWYRWLTGHEVGRVYLIDQGALMTHRRKPVLAFSQCEWTCRIWPDDSMAREVLSFCRGGRRVLQLTPGWLASDEAPPVGWLLLKAALARQAVQRQQIQSLAEAR